MEIYYQLLLVAILIAVTSAQYHPQSQQYRPISNQGPPAHLPPKPIAYPSYQGSFGGDYQKRVTPIPIILSHKQSLTHDGGFKYAFAADNGLQQGETIAPDGTRLGQYSYVDPSGQTIMVKYSAGKEGFRILEGAHVPQPAESSQRNQQQPQIYTQPEASPIRYSSGPQIFGPPRLIEANQGQNNDKYTQAYHQPSQYVHSTTPYPVQAPIPRYLQYKNAAQIDERRVNENAIQQEREYNDEPGKPHSFGNGYSFEFTG